MLATLCLSSLPLLASSCVMIPNITECSVLSIVADGMTCAETQTNKQTDLNFDELIDFLEPQDERTCVPISPSIPVCSGFAPTDQKPAVKLPKRAGAIITSAVDYQRQSTAFEQACRDLGSKCTPEIQAQVNAMKKNTPLAKFRKGGP